MKHFQRNRFAAWALPLAALSLVVVAVVFGDALTGSANDPLESPVEHGKYLVHHVAQCVQCHTPRDGRGALDQSRLLTGAPIPVAGPEFSRSWAVASVSLAGLGNYDESFVRHLLTHGARPDGTHPKSPMPSFKLSLQDADAVIAYLKSLK
ncbi:MAG: c-type cytochrome [Planctomycetota bacterium]